MQTKLNIAEGCSMYNGIMLYSKRHKNKMAVATINDDEITASWVDVDSVKEDETENKEGNKRNNKAIAIFQAILLVEMLIIASLKIIFDVSLNIIVRLIPFDTIIIMFLGIFSLDENTKRFHGAEHQIINAFNKLGRIPTIDELQKFSRFSMFCGTNSMANIGLISLLLLIETFIPHNAILIVVLWGLFIINVLNFFQYFTTSQPTDKEQRVAIEAIKVWFEYESKE